MRIPNQINFILRTTISNFPDNSMSNLTPQQMGEAVPFNPQALTCYFEGFQLPCDFVLPFCGSAFECRYFPLVSGKPQLKISGSPMNG